MSITIADLKNVYRLTYEARSKWRNTFLELDVSSATIDSIGVRWRDNPDDCYREGLSEWLKGGQRNWRDLVEALSSPTVGHDDIAMVIWRKYCADETCQPSSESPRAQLVDKEQEITAAGNSSKLKGDQGYVQSDSETSAQEDPSNLQGSDLAQEHYWKASRVLRPPLTLKWKKNEDMLFKMGASVQSVVIGNTVYAGGGRAYVFDDLTTCTVVKLDLKTDQQTRLPQFNAELFAMTSFANQLVLIGGKIKGARETTNQIATFTLGEWKYSVYPPMKLARHSSTATSFKDHIIVAGGFSYCTGGHTSSVEVLNVSSREWCSTESLPYSLSLIKNAIIGDTLYLMGGFDCTRSLSKRVLKVDMTELIDERKTVTSEDTNTKSSTQNLWQEIGATSFNHASPIGVGACLLAVGGCEPTSMDKCGKAQTSIHLYQPDTREWLKVGDLPKPRFCCTCSILPNGDVIVIGGQTDSFHYVSTVYCMSLSDLCAPLKKL